MELAKAVDPKLNEEEKVDKSLGRLGGEECGGKCKHSSTYHRVKLTNPLTNQVDWGCCRVDCACMAFQSSGKPNQDTQ